MTGGTSDLDALMAVIASARGTRPTSLACADAEDGLSISLALLIELIVANDRIDRLERMVGELKGMAPSPDDTETRRAANEALIVRVLHVLFDPRTPVDGHPATVPNG